MVVSCKYRFSRLLIWGLCGFRREELVKKMEKSGAKAYLVNTGWNGTGKRISIKDTRGIIDAILNGDIKTAPTKTIPYSRPDSRWRPSKLTRAPCHDPSHRS